MHLLAYRHARSMTHYVPAGARTPDPESLGPAGRIGAILGGVVVPRPANRRTPAEYGLDHRTIRFPGREGERIEAWLVAHPAPRGTALLFPGYAGSKEGLLPTAAYLHAESYAVLLVDFAGAGGSTGDVTTLGMREAEEVARAVGWTRGARLPRPHLLVGASMGSAAILRAVAVHGVRADGLVLESPFDRLATTIGNRFRRMGLPPFPGAEILLFWGGHQIGFNAFRHNPVEYAARVKIPALILHGTRDPNVTPAQARAVHDALAGPKSFETFPEIGHRNLFAADPGRWKAVFQRWFKENDATFFD